MKDIKEFKGDYFFLSNFYPCSIEYEGIIYSSVEAAYQAQKTLDKNKRKSFSNLTASQSKQKGKRIELRHDWEDVKVPIMKTLVYIKFNNKELREKLINTGDCLLIEGNWWGDTFWGVCNGVGENVLGEILMGARDYYCFFTEWRSK